MATAQELFSYIDAHAEQFKQFWFSIVSIESPSYHKAGVDAVAEHVSQFAKQQGFAPQTIPFEQAGNSVRIEIPGDTRKKPVLIMAHMDTVHKLGSFSPPLVREEGDKVFGPGVFDCKGGIAVALLAASALSHAGYAARPIRLFFTGDEEVGHVHSDGGKAIEAASQDAAVLFNCESGPIDGRLALGRKASYNFTVVVQGVGAHSGNDPEKGRSAILEAAYKIIEIQKLNDIFGSGTVVNTAIISGGTVTNAIPEKCEFSVNMRYKDIEDVKARIKKIQAIAAVPVVEGTTTTIIEGRPLRTPMLPNDKNNWVFDQWVRATASLGFETNTPYLAGGGSDATISYRLGVPVLDQVGVRGEHHHTLREYALISSLAERAKMLAKTILSYEDFNA